MLSQQRISQAALTSELRKSTTPSSQDTPGPRSTTQANIIRQARNRPYDHHRPVHNVVPEPDSHANPVALAAAAIQVALITSIRSQAAYSSAALRMRSVLYV